jgi:anti-anti-sigma factor
MSIQHVTSARAGPGDQRPLLTADITDSGPVTVIRVRGDLDLCTMDLLTERVDQVLRQQPLRLVLDLADLTFFCADGVRALHHIHHAVAGIAGDLVLRDPSVSTMRVLALTRTAHHFRIHVTTG